MPPCLILVFFIFFFLFLCFIYLFTLYPNCTSSSPTAPPHICRQRCSVRGQIQRNEKLLSASSSLQVKDNSQTSNYPCPPSISASHSCLLRGKAGCPVPVGQPADKTRWQSGSSSYLHALTSRQGRSFGWFKEAVRAPHRMSFMGTNVNDHTPPAQSHVHHEGGGYCTDVL